MLTCGHNKIKIEPYFSSFSFYIFPIGLLVLFLISSIKSVGQRLFFLKEDPTGFFCPTEVYIKSDSQLL